jgi:DNA-binding MarR family transcriptional regulator
VTFVPRFEFEALYHGEVSATRPDTDTSTEVGTPTGADGVQGLNPQQLGAYFALMETVSLLQHQVEQHLRTEGDLSYVQFQLLARLANAHGQLTMTQLADGVVYSRSGLTYQAGLLEKAGLITRSPSPDDERATLVTITDKGLALFGRVLPGHIEVVRRLLFDPLTADDLHHLGDVMTRVRLHMRAQPPRSATPRKRRPKPTSPLPGRDASPRQNLGPDPSGSVSKTV